MTPASGRSRAVAQRRRVCRAGIVFLLPQSDQGQDSGEAMGEGGCQGYVALPKALINWPPWVPGGGGLAMQWRTKGLGVPCLVLGSGKPKSLNQCVLMSSPPKRSQLLLQHVVTRCVLRH